jgi:hypothetical protein
MEVDVKWRIFCSLSIPGTIPGFGQNETTTVDLEAVGTAKVQILCMAYHQE